MTDRWSAPKSRGKPLLGLAHSLARRRFYPKAIGCYYSDSRGGYRKWSKALIAEAESLVAGGSYR